MREMVIFNVDKLHFFPQYSHVIESSSIHNNNHSQNVIIGHQCNGEKHSFCIEKNELYLKKFYYGKISVNVICTNTDTQTVRTV